MQRDENPSSTDPVVRCGPAAQVETEQALLHEEKEHRAQGRQDQEHESRGRRGTRPGGTRHGRQVAVGRAEWTAAEVPRWVRRVRRQASLDDALTVFVAVDGHLAGALLFRESARTPRRRYDGCARSACGGWCWLPATEPTSPRAWPQPWHRHGPGRADAGGKGRGGPPGEQPVRDNHGRGRPERRARPGHHRIGVALGARGSTASSEAADVVLTVDRLDRLAETIAIARRARRIALQSVLVGMGLSLAHARTVAPSQR